MDNKILHESLSDLALDLRWSWNHAADDLWSQLDPELWNLTHNAWLVLQTVSRPGLEAALADKRFREKLRQVLDDRRARDERSRWFEDLQPGSNLNAVAYFSMEF